MFLDPPGIGRAQARWGYVARIVHHFGVMSAPEHFLEGSLQAQGDISMPGNGDDMALFYRQWALLAR
ncbi:MAG: hypothetical protein L0322_28415, partial [Chloroflexi bacterium]|nr:hypothetical protein [Chloroflexota bacterium]